MILIQYTTFAKSRFLWRTVRPCAHYTVHVIRVVDRSSCRSRIEMTTIRRHHRAHAWIRQSRLWLLNCVTCPPHVHRLTERLIPRLLFKGKSFTDSQMMKGTVVVGNYNGKQTVCPWLPMTVHSTDVMLLLPWSKARLSVALKFIVAFTSTTQRLPTLHVLSDLASFINCFMYSYRHRRLVS